MYSEDLTLSEGSPTHFNGEREKEREWERKREVLAGLGLPPIRRAGVISEKTKVCVHVCNSHNGGERMSEFR